MPQQSLDFNPSTGDDTTGALRKLDNNISDHETRISNISQTAAAAMPKAGGTFSGDVNTQASNGQITTGNNGAGNSHLFVRSAGSGNAAYLSFITTFGANFGVDVDGQLAWGGYSMGRRYVIWSEHNTTVDGQGFVKKL